MLLAESARVNARVDGVGALPGTPRPHTGNPFVAAEIILFLSGRAKGEEGQGGKGEDQKEEKLRGER